MEKNKVFNDLGIKKPLNIKEMFDLKGGCKMDYGCESNVCNIDRSGAKDLCTDAYCRSGVGPKHPSDLTEF